MSKKLVGRTIFSLHLNSQVLNTPELCSIGKSHFTCGCQHPSLAKTLQATCLTLMSLELLGK